MNQNILHIGLDVDDSRYHGSAFDKQPSEIIDFRCRPTLKGLLTQLYELQRHFPGRSIRLCYEASYLDFHLPSLLRRNSLHFKAQTGYKSHWTKPLIEAIWA